MKNLLVTTVFIFIVWQSKAQYNVLKTDLVGPLRGKFGFAYERSLSQKFSVRIFYEFGTYGKGASFGRDDAYKLSGNGIIPEFRFYPVSTRRGTPAGLFIATAFRYLSFKESYQDESQGVFYPIISRGNLSNFGFDLGYQFTYKHFCVEALFGAGTGKMKKDDEVASSRIPDLYSNVLKDERKFIRAEILIGYIFPTIKKIE